MNDVITKKDLQEFGEKLEENLDRKLDTKLDERFEEFAIMVQNGFAGVQTELREFKTETRERFDTIDARFDHIENITLRSHENRLEKLEDDVLIIKTSLNKPSLAQA